MQNIVPGYDAKAAVEFVVKEMAKDKRFAALSADMLRGACQVAVQLDGEYMKKAGVADGDYYDEDEAYEWIVEGLIARYPNTDELLLAELADGYLDAHQAYLEQNDLLNWD